MNLAAGDTTEYSYDALDRRMEIRTVSPNSTTLTRFVYDGAHVVLDLDGQNNVLAEYLHGPGTDEILTITRDTITGYYAQDHMGSVVRILDPSGTVLNSYRYLAWGEVFDKSESIENRYGYTGRELNPDGRTMHYRAREYMPHHGRFLQEDPAGFVDGVNLYRYVGNGPSSFVDPSGLTGEACNYGEGPDVHGYEEQEDNRFQRLANWGAEQSGALGWLALNAGATLNAVAAVGDRISGVQCENGVCHSTPLAFTRGGAFTKGGFLNSNRYLRVGVNHHRGQKVFRISGQLIERVRHSGHIDLFWLGPL